MEACGNFTAPVSDWVCGGLLGSLQHGPPPYGVGLAACLAGVRNSPITSHPIPSPLQAPHPRGAACSDIEPQPGVKTFAGLEREGGGGSAGQLPGPQGGGGSVGTPTYRPQNDPHDVLIILKIHDWGKKKSRKNLPINSDSPLAKVQPGGRVGGQKCFLWFSPIFELSTKF